MRRAVPLALAASLWLAAPAAAHTPAVGGGSFNAAPLLGPGVYRDTVRSGEYLYYGIPLAAGQRLHVRVRIRDADPATWRRAAGPFTINLHTPQREQVTPVVDEDVTGNGNTSAGIVVTDPASARRLRWDFYGPPAMPFAEAAASSSTYAGPGTWYVSLHPVSVAAPLPIELPVELELDADGAPQDEPPDPRPTPEATPSATPAPPGDGDGGAGLPALLGLGAAGLAAGLALARVLARR